MANMSRRSVLGGLSLASTGALSRPYIANAAAKTGIVWINQGFVPEEDAAFRKTAADYEAISGNKIDYSIMPFQALNQKAISALTSGDVPDLIFHDAPATILPQNAWDDRLEDVSDIVELQKAGLSETAVLASSFYNSVTKKRAFYMVPIKQACAPFHVWGDLVQKAGFDLKDAPKTWDAFWDFFKPMQPALRAKGMRKIYGIGLQITTVGPNDGNGLFTHFLFANGGQDMVTRDGKLHTDDPVVREAAIHSVEYMTNVYKEGYVPPEALSWSDSDDNNAYHEKAFVMDLDGTLSTELAMIKNKKAYYEEMVVMSRRRRRLHSKRCEKLRGGPGLHDLLHEARGDEREPEGRTGPLGAGHSIGREDRPVVDRLEKRSASPALCHRGGVKSDVARL
jgi:multiple sugar transport system substrate-binding protein